MKIPFKSYRDQLLHIAKLYGVVEIKSYSRSAKKLTIAQLELLLIKNRIKLPINRSSDKAIAKQELKENTIRNIYLSLCFIIFVGCLIVTRPYIKRVVNEVKFTYVASEYKSGEINKLSKLVRPNVGIITNVAQAHIENFKNIKGIAKAKSEIINNIDKDGILVLNRDDRFFNYFNSIARRKKIKILSFGRSKKADIYLIQNKISRANNFLKIRAIDEILNLKTNSSSNLNISNILCSIAVLKILNLDLAKIGKFFEENHSLTGRGKIHRVARYKTKFKLIDESYNANPLSVKNAIINLSNIKKNNCKKYILLGDMLELGKKSDFYHKNLSKIINVADVDKLFVYGDKVIKTYKYTSKNKQGNILQNKNDFDDVFSEVIKRNDYLMIKGSNATGLKKLSKNIIRGATSVI